MAALLTIFSHEAKHYTDEIERKMYATACAHPMNGIDRAALTE